MRCDLNLPDICHCREVVLAKKEALGDDASVLHKLQQAVAMQNMTGRKSWQRTQLEPGTVTQGDSVFCEVQQRRRCGGIASAW